VLLLFEFHRLPQRVGLALEEGFLLRELLQVPLRLLELQLGLHRVARGLDRAPGVEPCQHIARRPAGRRRR
jgi:hypothetical protein